MQRQLTVVFPIFVNSIGSEKHFYVMMGKQASGKRLEGVRNGYGGKCEEGESPEDCAVRELVEETGIVINKNKLIYVGKLIQNEKEVFFYVYLFDEKFSILDNSEFVDNRWFELNNFDEYVHEMLSGDLKLMKSLKKVLDNYYISGEVSETFNLDQSANQELTEKTKKIFQ